MKTAMKMMAALVLLLCGSVAQAELGAHWWPAGNAAWSPRDYMDVVEFQGALYLIGGKEVNGVEHGEPIYGPAGDVWRSFDGITWSRVTRLQISDRCSAVASDSLLWFNAGSYTYSYSSDGADWTTRANTTLLLGGNHDCGARLVYSFGQFWNIVSGWGSTAPNARNSVDGLSWNTVDLTPSDTQWSCLYGLAVLDNKLLAIMRNSNQNWISEDGVTWSPVVPSENRYRNQYIRDVVVDESRVWVLAYDGIFWSSDAVNWYGPVNDNFDISTRDDYTAVAFQDRLWIFGGRRSGYYDNGEELLNDIWYSEDTAEDIHRADYLGADGVLELSEILRLVQLYQFGKYHCDGLTEDSYAPGEGYETCFPHSSDYNPQDWRIDLRELLRAIQLYNIGGYIHCPEAGTEDGFCPLPGL